MFGLFMEKNLKQKLNKRETYKARLKPYDYFQEFETLDFDSLGEGDRYYLQDFGIFTTDFLEGEFTVRLRNAGGKLSTKQFRYIADIVQEYELTLVITARAGFQLHDVESDNLLEIWKKLNQNGLTTWQSFGDNVRNIVSDVYDGVGKYAEIEVYPLIEKMQNYILKNPKYVGMLPRRVSIGISGNSANVNSFFANDLYFALAKKENVYGFNVYMGGKNTEIAKDADIFLKQEEVFNFFTAFVETFYQHGSRFSRSKTRLFYMIERMGIKGLKKLIQTQQTQEFASAGDLELQHVDFQEFEKLKDNSYAFCYQSDFGRLKPNEMRLISDFALKHNAEIRIGIDQNIYLIGLKNKEIPFSSAALSSTVVACAGNLCPYAVWSIKDEAHQYLPLEKIYKYGIKVGFSGCAKGCGRHRHVDIGLIGLKTNNFGDTDGGARIFIGAEHDTGKSVARQLFSMVPFVHLKTTLTLVVDLFEQSRYQNFQLYAHNVLNNYSEDFLALWHLMNLKTDQTLPLLKQTHKQAGEDEFKLLKSSFEEFELVENDMKKTVSYLAKELWTIEGKDPHYKPPIKRVATR